MDHPVVAGHVPRGAALAIVLAVAVLAGACSAGAKQGAARGARSGAVGGLVAGAVASVFWGGDAVNNALRSATVGAASGAAVGAVNAADREKPRGASPARTAPAGGLSAADNARRLQVGDLNFSASEELARCRHVSAISRAETAFATETDPKRRAYALLIQAMAAEESGNAGKANAVYARWARLDPARADPAVARNEALLGLMKVQKVRQEQGLPVLCT